MESSGLNVLQRMSIAQRGHYTFKNMQYEKIIKGTVVELHNWNVQLILLQILILKRRY
jgi:hypothetical protein